MEIAESEIANSGDCQGRRLPIFEIANVRHCLEIINVEITDFRVLLILDIAEF